MAIGLLREDLNVVKAITASSTPLTHGTLAARLSEIGATVTTLLVTAGSWAIGADLTIPANVTLMPVSGATFSISSGRTLTINGPLIAGRRQIFSGDGGVVCGPLVDTVYPEWFGALANGITMCTTALRQAEASIANGGTLEGAVIGTYLVNDEITYRSRQNWRGVRLRLANATVANLITTHLGVTVTALLQPAALGVTNVNFIDLEIDGNKANNPSTNSGTGLEIYGTQDVRVIRAFVHDCSRDGIHVAGNASNTYLDHPICRDIGLPGVNGGNGIAAIITKHLTMIDPICTGCILMGIDLEANPGDPAGSIEDVSIVNGLCQNNSVNGFSIHSYVDDQIRDVNVDGLRCVGNGERGALVVAAIGSSRAFDLEFHKCYFRQNGFEGLELNFATRVSVIGCTFDSNSSGNAGVYSGCVVHSTSNKIIACDSIGGGTQRYGFEEVSGSDENMFLCNYASGNLTGAYFRAGPNSTFMNQNETWFLGALSRRMEHSMTFGSGVGNALVSIDGGAADSVGLEVSHAGNVKWTVRTPGDEDFLFVERTGLNPMAFQALVTSVGLRFTENSGDPPAPSGNTLVTYARDNSGTTQLMAVFATGAPRVLANEMPPTVTGERGGNTALTELLTTLATLGIIVDGTTA